MTNITVVNPYEVPTASIGEAVNAWDNFEKYFSQQEGYVSAKLLKSLDENGKFSLVTISEWKSQESFNEALANQELKKIANAQPKFQSHSGAFETIRGA